MQEIKYISTRKKVKMFPFLV